MCRVVKRPLRGVKRDESPVLQGAIDPLSNESRVDTLIDGSDADLAEEVVAREVPLLTRELRYASLNGGLDQFTRLPRWRAPASSCGGGSRRPETRIHLQGLLRPLLAELDKRTVALHLSGREGGKGLRPRTFNSLLLDLIEDLLRTRVDQVSLSDWGVPGMRNENFVFGSHSSGMPISWARADLKYAPASFLSRSIGPASTVPNESSARLQTLFTRAWQWSCGSCARLERWTNFAIRRSTFSRS